MVGATTVIVIINSIAAQSYFAYHRTMKEYPGIARLGALIGDPARANMLTALIDGKALTPSELAAVAGVTLPTTSAHLSKLIDGGLVAQRKQGRHRYVTLADQNVAALLERMLGLAAEKGHVRVHTGPKDPALRKARVCYNHLAGELAVQMYDSMCAHGLLTEQSGESTLTKDGEQRIIALGVDVAPLVSKRRPLCKPCLDWSARRSHLAGALGSALLNRFYELRWASREHGTRVVHFTKQGESAFRREFPV
jgi:DNA-binding transcriptional ArsR family regulator